MVQFAAVVGLKPDETRAFLDELVAEGVVIRGELPVGSADDWLATELDGVLHTFPGVRLAPDGAGLLVSPDVAERLGIWQQMKAKK